MGIGFLFSVPWYIVPHLESSLLSLDQISNLFLCLLYPFSAGITIGNVVFPSVSFSTVLMASVAMIGYVILTGAAGKWTLETVKRTSQGTGIKIERVAARDFSIKIHNPLLSYVVKDLKTSSRNPATAFFFALPVLETIIVSLLITNFEMLKASTILVATTTGGIFALFMPLALLNAEGTGLEYTKTLPVTANRIITSKTLIATATYIPVPLTLLSLALMKQLTSPIAILIPYITTLAIASASIFEIKLFLDSAAKGRIAAIIHDLEKLVAGIVIILVPEVAYATTYFVSLDHILAILVMTVSATTELGIAVSMLRRS